MSRERESLLRLYGADVRVTQSMGGMHEAVAEAERLARETPDSFKPDQFSNPANPEAHRRGTAEEIWSALAGEVDAFVAGVGTGGTITGVGEVLKERRPEALIVAVEPTGSPVLSGGRPGPHRIQGIGAGFVPDVLNRAVIDELITVTDDDAIATAQQLARVEGDFRRDLRRRQHMGRAARGAPSRDAGQTDRDGDLRRRRALHIAAFLRPRLRSLETGAAVRTLRYVELHDAKILLIGAERRGRRCRCSPGRFRRRLHRGRRRRERGRVQPRGDTRGAAGRDAARPPGRPLSGGGGGGERGRDHDRPRRRGGRDGRSVGRQSGGQGGCGARDPGRARLRRRGARDAAGGDGVFWVCRRSRQSGVGSRQTADGRPRICRNGRCWPGCWGLWPLRTLLR